MAYESPWTNASYIAGEIRGVKRGGTGSERGERILMYSDVKSTSKGNYEGFLKGATEWARHLIDKIFVI